MFSVNFGVTSKKPMFLFCYRCALLVAGVFLLAHGQAQGGTTIRAASVALVDVTTAVASASSGDTVIIPAGTASWTSGLTITKGITLQGSTTVTGDHTTFNATTPAAMTANDLTIIQDNVPRGGFSPVFYFTYTSGTARVTGITVQAGTVSGSGDGGVFLANGSGVAVQTTLRIDHCHLYRPNNSFLETINGYVVGVMDHCLLEADAFHQGFTFEMCQYGGKSYGDGAWAAPTGFGSSDFFFLEDCVINNSIGAAQSVGDIDSYGGGKYVTRYCRWINCVATDHGTANTGRSRSVRAKEIYNNTFLFNRIAGSGGLQRGGCALIHDNTYTYVSPGWTTGITLTDYRTFDSFVYWGGANGKNAWDSNSDTANHTGNGLGGGPGGLFASGTVSANNTTVSDPVYGTLARITVAATPWTTNQWAGYSLTNTRTTKSGAIIRNTANTIDYMWYQASDEPAGSNPFTAGDTYNIYKLPLANIDQCGRGQGDLITGDPYSTPVGPYNTVTGTPSWPRNALEPVYSWNNTINGATCNIGSAVPTIKEGRDFYNNTPMPGYTPYTYPHPLVSGVWQANLRVVSGP